MICISLLIDSLPTIRCSFRQEQSLEQREGTNLSLKGKEERADSTRLS